MIGSDLEVLLSAGFLGMISVLGPIPGLAKIKQLSKIDSYWICLLMNLPPQKPLSKTSAFQHLSKQQLQPSSYYLGLKLIQICKSNFTLVSMFYPPDTSQQSISLVNRTYKIDFNLDLPSLYCLSSKLLSLMILPNPLLQSYPYSTFLVLCC